MAYHGIGFKCFNCGKPATRVHLLEESAYLDVPACDDCSVIRDALIPQVGQRMLDVCLAVSGNEGCSKLKASRMVDPRSPFKHGWRAVNRAIDAGLVKALRVDGGFQLYLTRLGWALTRDHI